MAYEQGQVLTHSDGRQVRLEGDSWVPVGSEPSMPLAGEAQAVISGANTLLPALAGMPVDFARTIANIGTAAYGVGRKEIGELLGEEGYIPPEPLPPMPGGSEWMKEKMTAGTQAVGGGDPFAMADPSDPTQQKLHLAGSVLGAGLMAPAAGVKQAAANVARMGVPAAGAVGMQTAFPEQPLAPLVGMMGAPAGLAAIKSKAAPTRAFLKAHKLGYKVPPALAKPSLKQNIVEGFGGTTPVSQKASLANQKITNELVRKDLGYPKDVPLSREGLAAMRAEAGSAYDHASKAGTLITDKTYTSNLNAIAQKGTALAKEFPELAKKDVTKMVEGFAGKKLVSSEAAVEAIKQLRADSSAGYTSLDPATKAMAKAQGKMADALDGLLYRNLSKTQPEIAPALKAARVKIAKTYTIEKALKGENVDAVALGRELKKGKPLSGGIKSAAEFGEVFPKAAKSDLPQYTTVSPMD